MNFKPEEIILVEKKMKSALLDFECGLDSYLTKFLFNSGKRLRPLFIFMICDLIELQIDEDVLNLASGVEFLHCASLIHDDILDNAQIRRNEPCIHINEGVKKAVLVGDYLLNLGIDFFSKTPHILPIITRASHKMILAEMNALNSRHKNQTLEFYLQNIKDKTGALFLAGVYCLEKIKNIKIDEEIFKFTEIFALCFQIKDDINNYKGEESGKYSSDKENGICTLPLILGDIDRAESFLDNLILNMINIMKKYKKGEPFIHLIKTLYEKENK